MPTGTVRAYEPSARRRHFSESITRSRPLVSPAADLSGSIVADVAARILPSDSCQSRQEPSSAQRVDRAELRFRNLDEPTAISRTRRPFSYDRAVDSSTHGRPPFPVI